MVWIILAIIFTILFLLFNLYLKIEIIYIDEDFKVLLKIFLFKLQLIPAEEEKPVKKKPKRKEKKKVQPSDKPTEKKKSTFDDIMDIIEVVKQISEKVLYYFNKYLKIDIKLLRVKVAADDAASAAILYGLVSQGVAYLLEIFRENVKKVKEKRKDSIIVTTDFTSDKFESQIDIIFKIRIWQILILGINTFKEFLINITNKTEALKWRKIN